MWLQASQAGQSITACFQVTESWLCVTAAPLSKLANKAEGFTSACTDTCRMPCSCPLQCSRLLPSPLPAVSSCMQQQPLFTFMAGVYARADCAYERKHLIFVFLSLASHLAGQSTCIHFLANNFFFFYGRIKFHCIYYSFFSLSSPNKGYFSYFIPFFFF